MKLIEPKERKILDESNENKQSQNEFLFKSDAQIAKRSSTAKHFD